MPTNPEGLPSVSPETTSPEREQTGLSPEDQAVFNQASEKLAKAGFPRRGERLADYAQFVLRHKETSSIVGAENHIFQKLAEPAQLAEDRAETSREAEAALKALENVKENFLADGWIAADKLTGSAQEQARAILREYGYMQGEVPGTENFGLISADDLKALRALEHGNYAKLEQKNENMPQAA